MTARMFKAALLITCAGMASPTLAQSDSARQNHSRLSEVVVYGQETGEERGFIDPEAYDELLASSATPENVKQNLRSGVQWAITTGDGRRGWVSPDFECIKVLDFQEFPQCQGSAEAGKDIFELSIPRSQPALNRLVAAPEQADAARSGRVAFVSSDGSASVGSRSVFILRNTSSGETILVPVDGHEATWTEISIRPGNYEVIPPAPSINGYQSFYTKKVSETQITVNAGGSPVLVDFSLGVMTTPVAIRVGEVTSDSVALDWDSLPDVNIESYTLVRTDGGTEAANIEAGNVVTRGQANTTNAVAKGLSSSRMYTFTLFSKARDGSNLPTRSLTVSTSRKTSDLESSYALAPNTIVPDNFAALRAEPVSATSIRVALPANLKRGSSSPIPGVAEASLEGNGCVVGTPFLVTTDVAGDQSFYGLIDACEGPPTGASSAIVNRQVPLSAVFDYFSVSTIDEAECYDAMTGRLLSAGNNACTLVQEQPELVADDMAPAQQTEAGDGETPNGPTLPFRGEANLVREQRYSSASGHHYLIFQNDGNLVVYTANGQYVWGLDREPDVDFRRIARVTWQGDGNLAAYSADNQWIWSALHEGPDSNALLWLNEMGTLQIVVDDRVMWSATTPLSSRIKKSAGEVDSGEVTPSTASLMAGSGISPSSFQFVGEGRGYSKVNKRFRYNGINTQWQEPTASYASNMLDAGPLNYQNTFTRRLTLSDSIASMPWIYGRSVPGESIIRIEDPSSFSAAGSLFAMASSTQRLKCEGKGSAKFALAPRIDPLKKFSLTISGGALNWDIQAGVTASFNPAVEFDGSYSCALDLPSIDIKFAGAAVPVSLRLKPDVSAEATASLKVNGPSLALDVGIQSTGRITVETRSCKVGYGWLSTKVLCGASMGVYPSTKPIANFRRGGVSANITGTLTFRAGVEANLGFGYDIGIAKARSGFALTLSPLSAELKAQAGTASCVSASIGYQIDAALVAEAYIPVFLDEEKRYPLYESGHQGYPNATFGVGDCGDD